MFNTALTVAKDSDVELAPAGLPGKLEWLRRFGKPSISVPDEGWHARISMNTNATGSEFTVKSEFKMRTAEEAVDQLIERMLQALAAVNGAK